MENRPGKGGKLESVVKSDLQCCMRSFLTSCQPVRAKAELALSVHVANIVGLSTESVVSVLFSSLPPTHDKKAAIRRLTEEFNITEAQIESFLTSKD